MHPHCCSAIATLWEVFSLWNSSLNSNITAVIVAIYYRSYFLINIFSISLNLFGSSFRLALLTFLVYSFHVFLLSSWVFGSILCKAYYFITSFSYTASIFILVVISMERYLAIQHPITSKQILTSSRLKVSTFLSRTQFFNEI